MKWFLHAAISSNFMHYQSQFPVSLPAQHLRREGQKPNAWRATLIEWNLVLSRLVSSRLVSSRLVSCPAVAKIIYSTGSRGRCWRSVDGWSMTALRFIVS